MSSRKKGGTGNKLSKTERADKMARKRDERAIRQAHRKQRQMESYFSDDENFTSFSEQMVKMGLQLRDIPGDGNCLFRALGDQLQGHGRNHHKFRMEVAKYMLEHRDDFEPFVEDDIPFERHVANLRKLGTYAGNDAIVAFARLHGVNVVIHQLNSPLWTIKGVEKASVPELHISYHNGDHYSSIRRCGDNAEAPANITLGKVPETSASDAVKTFQKPGYNYGGAASYTPTYNEVSPTSASAYTSYFNYEEEDSDYDNLQPEDYAPKHAAAAGVARAYRGTNDIIEQLMLQSGCQDRVLVQQTLEENGYDVELSLTTIDYLMHAGSAANSDSMSESSYQTSDSGIWSENGTATRIFGSSEAGAAHHQSPETSTKTKPLSTKERKAHAKREKKLKATERHRQRLRGDASEEMNDDTTVVTHGMGILQI